MANENRMNAAEISDCEKAIIDGILTMPPKRRIYNVGQRVQWGAHKETYVREVYRDGMYYLTETNISSLIIIFLMDIWKIQIKKLYLNPLLNLIHVESRWQVNILIT